MSRSHSSEGVTTRSARLLVIALLAAVGLGILGAGVAFGYWLTTSSNPALALADTLPAGATPNQPVTTPDSNGNTVQIIFSQANTTTGHVPISGYTLNRYPSSGGSKLSNVGSCATPSGGSVTCTESDVPDGNWVYTDTPTYGTNWTGSESAKSPAVLVDTSPPINHLSLSGQSGGGSFLSGTTVYYQGSTAGSFTLTNALTDSGSGPASSTFPTLGGATSGWSHTASTDTTSPYVSTTFSWGNGTTSSPTETVTGTDNVGNTNSGTQLTFVNDSTAPVNDLSLSGQSGGGSFLSGTTVYYHGSTAGSFTLTNALTDSGSGPASSTFPTLGGATSGWSHTASTDTTSPYVSTTFNWGNGTTSSPTETVTGTDNAGNTVTTTLTFVNDSTAPVNDLSLSGQSGGGSFLSGTTVYYHGSTAGSFTITNALTDSGSGPASSTFAGLGGSKTGWSFTTSTVSSPTGGPYVSTTFNWGNGTTSSPTETVTGTDNVGNTVTTTLTFVNDSTAPVNNLSLSGQSGGGSFLSGTTVYYQGSTAGSFTLTNALTDSGSGPASSTFPTLGGATSGWSHTASTDTTSPYVSTTFSWGNGTTSSPTETVTGTDNVGNTNSGTQLTFVNDSTAPVNDLSLSGQSGGGSFLSGTTVYYHGSTAGSFTLTNALTDSGSGPASSTFPTLGGATSGWSHTASTDTTSPYVSTTFNWGNGTTSSPTETVTGTDNAGNTVTTTLTFVNDSTAPVNDLSLSGQSGGGSFLSGTTVYYHGSTAGSFTITNALTDSGSGPASSTFAGLGGSKTGWSFTTSTVSSPTGGPYVSTTFNWGNGTTSSPTETVTGTDNVGNTVTTTLTFVNDSTAPVNNLSLSGQSGGGSFLSGTTVYYQGSTAGSFTLTNALTDSGSGPASSTFPTLGGATSGWSHTASTDTTSPYVSTTFSWGNGTTSSPTETVTGTDNVGNTNSGTQLTFVNDSTAPVNDLSLSGQSGGGSFLSGTTVYYHGSTAGSFTLTNALTDSGSGPASSTFPTLGGATSGWSHTASTDTTSPYVSTTFNWGNGTTSSPTETVTGTDNAGNTVTTTLTFVNDSTAPTGSVTYTNGYVTSTSASIAFSATDGTGSGVNSGTAQLERASATLSGGTCGSYGAFTQVGSAGLSSPFSDTVATGNCYEYEYVVSDNVGNQGTITSASVLKVDTAAPVNNLSLSGQSGGSFLSGTTVYYRGSAAGSFTITNALTDSGSGPASSAFPALGGTTTGWSHTASTDTTSPYVSTTFSWGSGTTSSPSETITGTDNAGNTVTTTLTFVNDSTAPTGSVTYTNGYVTSTTLSVPFSASDAGSGVNSGGGQLMRRSATLSGSSCGSYGSFAQVGTTGLSSPFSDTVATGNCYEYEYVVSDNVGNQGTITSSDVAKIDTNTLNQNAPNFSGSIFSKSVTFSGDASYSGSVTVYYCSSQANPCSSSGDTGSATTTASGGGTWSVQASGTVSGFQSYTSTAYETDQYGQQLVSNTESWNP